MTRRALHFLCAALVPALIGACRNAPGQPPANSWKPPVVRLPDGAPHPRIACTPEELARLRNAWQGKGPPHNAVAPIIRRADSALEAPLEFPPRGGQHNQWYQCDNCQAALKTVDAHHHQCPLCKKVYSGPPYDDVVFSRLHHRNLQRLLDCAWAYAITAEEKYAGFARKVLLGYAARYRTYPFHGNSKRNVVWNRLSGGHLFEQTLSEASALAAKIAPAYDLVWAAPVFDTADRRRIRDGLFVPMLRNIDRYKAGIGNWQTWHNAAMFCGGAVIGHVEWMRKAVFGETNPSLTERLVSRLANIEAKRLNRRGNSFVFQMQHSVTADGMWFEGSWGYHFYALQALVTMTEAARRLGIDLWHYPGFEKMFTLPLQYAMPDGSLPRFGDDVHTTVRGRDALFEPAYAVFRDPVLLTSLPRKPTWFSLFYGRNPTETGPVSVLKTVVFRNAGHAVLRTAGTADLVSAMTFGPYGGYHGHYDKLSFVFFGYGRELGVDPGRARSQAYRLPIHRHWYKATLSHNAVLVDGRSQKGVAGDFLWSTAIPTFAAVGAGCDRAFQGVTVRRALIQTPEYLLVIDALASKKEHTFTWTYHNRGTAVNSRAALQPCKKLEPAFPGSEYLRDLRTGTANGSVTAEFAMKNLTVHLLMAAGRSSTRVVTGTGVGAAVTERVPLLQASRRGRGVEFATVLAPVLPGRQCPVLTVRSRRSGSNLAVHVLRRGGGRDIVRIGQNWCGLSFERDARRILATPKAPTPPRPH
ncbi:MAG: alginate lyase family protein [Kiritimatiellaeota bacterium]|nr:alginate lyase family protein [Kiritimatiellota bacterium]